jgi:translation initiation factor 6
MEAVKCQINGSDFIGAFATCTGKFVFVAEGVTERARALLKSTLKAECFGMTIYGTDLVGIFMRGNSNGIAISNVASDYEIGKIKELGLDLNVGVITSDINAVGNNVIVNDKIAIINPEYRDADVAQFEDIFGVEVVRKRIGNFNTVGANNILTNSGIVINNHATDEDKEGLDRITGFESVRTTANTGALSIGLSTISNSAGVVAGSDTTGYELSRIMNALS